MECQTNLREQRAASPIWPSALVGSIRGNLACDFVAPLRFQSMLTTEFELIHARECVLVLVSACKCVKSRVSRSARANTIKKKIICTTKWMSYITENPVKETQRLDLIRSQSQ